MNSKDKQHSQAPPGGIEGIKIPLLSMCFCLPLSVCLSAICLSIYVSHLPLQAPQLLVHLCLCILYVSVSTWVCLSGTRPGRAGEGLEMTVKETLPPGTHHVLSETPG